MLVNSGPIWESESILLLRNLTFEKTFRNLYMINLCIAKIFASVVFEWSPHLAPLKGAELLSQTFAQIPALRHKE